MNEASPCRSIRGSVWLILYLPLFLDTENHAAQAGSELPVFLPLPPGCWWVPAGAPHHPVHTAESDKLKHSRDPRESVYRRTCGITSQSPSHLI